MSIRGWVAVVMTLGVAACAGSGTDGGSFEVGPNGPTSATEDDTDTDEPSQWGSTGSQETTGPNTTVSTLTSPTETTGPGESTSSDESTGPGETTGDVADIECRFESRTVFINAAGQTVESIIAYGRRFDFVGEDLDPEPENGEDVASWPHYAQGPCAEVALGECQIDTRVVALLDGAWVESITATGRYWNFTLDPQTGTASPWPSNGASLDTVERYASGPCADQPAEQCVFDSRLFLVDGDTIIESITAAGRYWNFETDAEGTTTAFPDNGSQLSSVERYANGPCENQPRCVFDARSIFDVSNVEVESIIAQGRYYNFNAGHDHGWPSNGSPLGAISRYASGPCSFVED